MQMWSECVPCIDTMVSTVARMALGSEAAVDEFMAEVRQLPAMVDPSVPIRPPEVVEQAWRLLLALTGDPDPLAEVKRRHNELALKLYVPARAAVLESDDPFGTAVKFAAAGNILDAMVDVTRGPQQDFVAKVAALPVDPHRLAVFGERVGRARRMVYFSDNCGEIVFDRLLLEVIGAPHTVDVTFVVRSVPVINDATVADALAVDLDAVATVVGNGIPEAVPASILGRASQDVRDLVASADLVVSKGGANYEVLDDEPSLAGKVTFILFGKCDPLCGTHDVGRGDLILLNA